MPEVQERQMGSGDRAEALAELQDMFVEQLDVIAELAAYTESKHLASAVVHLLAAIRLIHEERERA